MSIKTMSQQTIAKAIYNKMGSAVRGSALFAPTGRLTVADNAALNMGTGDFTWELWFNTSVSSGYQILVNKGDSYTGTTMCLNLQSGTVNFASGIVGGSFSINTWNHLALTRSGTSTKLWLNGVQQGSTLSDSTNYSTATSLSIGDRTAGHPNGQYPFTGYISNVRLVKGTALYTSAFTVPTSALTAVSGTSLLTCQDANKIVDRSANAFTVTSTGTVSASSSKPFA